MTLTAADQRIFDFALPGIDNHRFVVPVPQVITLIEAPDIYPIPFTPSPIQGVARHQGNLFTVVDLGTLFTHAPPMGVVSHMLIVSLDGKAAWAGWPVRNDATIRQAPATPKRQPSPLSDSPLVAAVVEGPTAILDLTRLVEAIRME